MVEHVKLARVLQSTPNVLIQLGQQKLCGFFTFGSNPISEQKNQMLKNASEIPQRQTSGF